MTIVKRHIICIILLLAGNAQAQVEISPKASKKANSIRLKVIEATAEESKGNIDRALDIYKECLKIDKLNPVVHFEISKIYKQMSELTSAVEHAEKAVELDQSNPWFKIHLGELYAYTTLFREASLVYEGLAESHPTYENIKRYAELLIHSGDLDQAITAYGLIESKYGHSPNISRQKTRLYYELDKSKNAISELNELSVKYPRETEYPKILGALYMDLNQPEKAVQTYQTLIDAGAADERVHFSLYRLYMRAEDTTNALTQLPFVFGSNGFGLSDKIRILYSLFELTYDDDEYRNAVYELLDTIVAVHPNNSESYTIYGDFLYRDSKLKEAGDMFEKSLEYEAEKFQVWNQLMIIDRETDQYEQLLSHSEKALERFPNQPSVYYYNGIALYNLEQYEAAIDMLSSGKSLIIDNKDMTARFLHALGNAYYKNGDATKGFSYFDQALELDPNNYLLINNYAYFLAEENNRINDAEKMVLAVLDEFPDNPSYLDTYAWVLFRKKKYSQAKDVLEKALKIAPENNVPLEHMGDILFHLDDKSNALEYWKKAKAFGNTSPQLDEKINTGKYLE